MNMKCCYDSYHPGPRANEGNLRNLNGNNIISSVESPDNPNFKERVLARYKTSVIVKIDINVHIQDAGVNRLARFQNFVISRGYLVKKYSCP